MENKKTVSIGSFKNEKEVPVPPIGVDVIFSIVGSVIKFIKSHDGESRETTLIESLKLIGKRLKSLTLNDVKSLIFADIEENHRKVNLISVLDKYTSILSLIEMKNYNLCKMKVSEILSNKDITEDEADKILKHIYVYCYAN
jgi:hypothetical protein